MTSGSPWPLPTEGVRLNLGCQTDIWPGWVNVDRTPMEGVVLCDLDADYPWPWDDDSVDFILASHVVEHLHDFGHFMREAYRVLKPGAEMVVLTPAPQDNFWNDPTHVRPYTLKTFQVYCCIRGGFQLEGMPCWSKVDAVQTGHSIPYNDYMTVVNARLTK